MNTIKNSFSKIKASDEFKDKLLKELQASSIKQNKSVNNVYESNVLNPRQYKEEGLSNRKIYYKQYAATAAIFCVLIGLIGSKLVLTRVQKENINSEIIAYDPQIEPATNTDFSEKNSNNNKDIKPQPAETNISSKNEPTDESTKTEGSFEKAETSKSYIKSETIINEAEKSNASSKIDENNLDDVMVSSYMPEDQNSIETASANSVYVPKYELTKTNTYASRKMIPLIIYKGNVYIHTNVKVSSENVNNFLGKKLGTTKDIIAEESSEKEYSNELTSNIGVTDVYSVNGYDETFRIMTNYRAEDGINTADFYECLNGITISSGRDVFSKLNLIDNVIQAKFQSYSDWNNGTGVFHAIDNINFLNDLFREVNEGIPYLSEDIDNLLRDYRNDNEYREISLDLKDGSKNITLGLLKSGYISYGYPKIYFKIDSNFSEELWNKLNP